MVDLAGASWREANAEQRAWRKANNYYGVGGFWSKIGKGFKKIGKAVWKPAAKAALGLVPGGSAVSTALGLGRYDMGGIGSYGEISTNDIVHGGSGDSMAVAKVNPTMEDDSGDVIMSHSEFIGNVVATAVMPAGSGSVTTQSTFQNSPYAINPGLQGSFPFLCQLAQNYTMYRLEGVIYQYKPLSGEGGGETNSLGKVIMATDYDPMALPFINSVQMENYQYSQSTKPSLAARHGVECKPSQGITDMKYIRTGTSNRDRAFTDYGLFQIATEGIPITGLAGSTVTSNIGELWVSYKVRLSRANLYSSLLGYAIRNDLWQYDNPSMTINTELVLDNPVNTPNSNNLGTSVKVFAGNATTGFPDTISIEWPVSQILGTYKVTVYTENPIGDGTSQTAWVPNTLATYAKNGFETQWGCPYSPMANFQDLEVIYPSINMTTGFPNQQQVTTLADLQKIVYYDPCIDNAVPYNRSSMAYFAINAPTTTTARMSWILVNTTTDDVPNQIPGTSRFASGANKIKVFVEQVNAETSNKPKD
jgi:hypothetical protein